MNQCVYWRSRNCRKGASCLFAHSADAPLPPCKYGKQCRFGKDCLFGHPDRDNLSNNQQYGKPHGYGQQGQSQYYAGSSGGSGGGFAGSPAGGPPGSLPPSTMGSSASSGGPPHQGNTGRGYQSRVPSTSPYGNVQGMPYATHFQPSPYGHPYSMPMTQEKYVSGYSHAGMSHPERGPYGAPQSSQQRMMPGRTPPSTRQNPSMASGYAAVPSRGGVAPGPGGPASGGGMAGGSQPTLSQQMPPQQNMRSMESMVPESRAAQMASADQDAEALISSGIQGMAI